MQLCCYCLVALLRPAPPPLCRLHGISSGQTSADGRWDHNGPPADWTVEWKGCVCIAIEDR